MGCVPYSLTPLLFSLNFASQSGKESSNYTLKATIVHLYFLTYSPALQSLGTVTGPCLQSLSIPAVEHERAAGRAQN